MKNEFVLLKFFATWCEPCKWAEPMIKEALALLADPIPVEPIDVDQQKDLADLYNIKSVPVFVLLMNGKEAWRLNGFDTAYKMAAAIRSAIEQSDIKE
jgi:thiol-disulfide isomerase/thioredoxin